MKQAYKVTTYGKGRPVSMYVRASSPELAKLWGRKHLGRGCFVEPYNPLDDWDMRNWVRRVPHD